MMIRAMHVGWRVALVAHTRLGVQPVHGAAGGATVVPLPLERLLLSPDRPAQAALGVGAREDGLVAHRVLGVGGVVAVGTVGEKVGEFGRHDGWR